MSQKRMLWVSCIILTSLPIYYYVTKSTKLILLQPQSLLDSVHWTVNDHAKTLQQNISGYLTNKTNYLEFTPYDYEVDLRIIVLTFNRSLSLVKCLESINSADYLGANVSVHIWIDKDPINNSIDTMTDKIAKEFRFKYGNAYVHHHINHVGIIGQWLNTWRPYPGSSEQVVFLEDDISVSPYYWKWLRSAHTAYDSRDDISGYGLSHPGISHAEGDSLIVPANTTIFLYRVICTWGYSPHPGSWYNFQHWYYRTGYLPSFSPTVPGILPTQWYEGEKRKGREKSLWEMWHIYFTHNSQPPQFSVILNSQYEGLLGVNRHELGLHDQGRRSEPWEFLLTDWKEKFEDFPEEPERYNYDGNLIIGSNYTYQYGLNEDV